MLQGTNNPACASIIEIPNAFKQLDFPLLLTPYIKIPQLFLFILISFGIYLLPNCSIIGCLICLISKNESEPLIIGHV